MTIRASQFLLSALAALGATLLACGDDSSNNDEDRQPATNGNDNGNGNGSSNQNGGMDAGASACFLPFEECTTCDQPPCLQECQNGQFVGDCFSIDQAGQDILNEIVDSGILEDLGQAAQDGINAFLDSGIVTSRDGGISINLGNDASIEIEAKPCPEPMVCLSQTDDEFIRGLLQLAGGLGICLDPETNFPPDCTMADTTECDALGFEEVMCSAVPPFPGFCIQTCQ